MYSRAPWKRHPQGIKNTNDHFCIVVTIVFGHLSPPPPLSNHGDDRGELGSWRMVRGFYNFIPLLWTAMQFVVGAHIRLNIHAEGFFFAKSEFVELQESTVDEHKQIASVTPRNSALLRATSLWARRPVVPYRSSDLLSPRATSLHPRGGSVYRSPAPCNCNYALYAVHTQRIQHSSTVQLFFTDGPISCHDSDKHKEGCFRGGFPLSHFKNLVLLFKRQI